MSNQIKTPLQVWAGDLKVKLEEEILKTQIIVDGLGRLTTKEKEITYTAGISKIMSFELILKHINETVEL